MVWPLLLTVINTLQAIYDKSLALHDHLSHPDSCYVQLFKFIKIMCDIVSL